MQFSRKFMILSILILALAILIWTVAINGEPEKAGNASAESAPAASGQKSEQGKAMDSLKKLGGKETPITVEAESAFRGTLIQRVSAQGRVWAYQQMDVINEVSGRLIKLNVRDGQKVKKGQIIAEIDDREYLLDKEDAEGKYLAAQADYLVYDESLRPTGSPEDSKKNLETRINEIEAQYKQGLISKEDYERKKFELDLDMIRSGGKRTDIIAAKTFKQASVILEKSKLMLEKCKVIAPFDGVVFGLEVSRGQFLNVSTKMARLINMEDLVVKVKVLESEIGFITEDRPALIKFTALPDLGEVEGMVKAVSPFVNEEDKTVDTIVSINKVGGGIRPGMFAEVKIDSRIYEDRLMVPKLSILPRDNRKVIFKINEESRAQWVYVKTGVENDEFVEITEGEIAPGDMVLTDNHYTMGHDTLVKIARNKRK